MSYEKLPVEVRAIGGLLTAGLTIFLGIKIYRKINPTGTDKADKEENKANTDALKSATDLLSRYIKIKAPTASNAAFQAWANALYKAMDGTGTSVGTINNIIGFMQCDTDVIKLIVTFGIRNRKTNNPFSSEATPLTLNSWFAEELTTGELNDINKILAAKRIGYRF